jgi:ferrochelatase
MVSKYDALLVVSFGGPEGPEDVIPFLTNVLRGRNVPPERMAEVAKHYDQFGGVSPINKHNRQLIAALEKLLVAEGPGLPIYWGNRNWHPMLENTLQQMADDGVENALAFVTSAYGSYSGCRQYRENIEEALKKVGSRAPAIEKLRIFFNHPGFIEANVEHLSTSIYQLEKERRDKCKIVFSAHSIPTSMADGCHYEAQLRETGRLICEALELSDWDLVFQSRSGPPTQPWLVPDICDYLKDLKEAGYRDVVVQPIGFICDHLEVVFDLDSQAKQQADELGLNLIRAATAGTHPAFVNMIRDLILEKTDGAEPKYLGSMGLVPEQCSTTCCLAGARPGPVAARLEG